VAILTVRLFGYELHDEGAQLSYWGDFNTLSSEDCQGSVVGLVTSARFLNTR